MSGACGFRGYFADHVPRRGLDERHDPAITVIDQPVYALGKSVAELLIRRLQGDTGPAERLILPTTIIERESVAPPPANGKP